jgi:threonine dehydrogenase-like Zn-dependent dehydrogenase
MAASMQQLTYTAPGKVEWLEAPLPKLGGPAEALVEPIAVATCDLDPLIVSGRTPYQPPIAVGHEAIGRVVEVGNDVQLVAPNDVVAVPFQISCGQCHKCGQGHTGNCASVPFLSMYGFGKFAGDWGGALSDLIRIPYADHMLVPLATQTDAVAVASLGDNIVDGWRTVAPLLENQPGADVLVFGGAGSIGIYAAGIAAALGAGRVDYVDADTDRRGRAERLGANVIEAWDTDAHDAYPVTVDASGDPEGLRAAIRSTAPDGTCTSIGIYFAETPLPLLEMYTRITTFHTGRVHARPYMPVALALVESGRFHPEIVTSRVVPWNDAAEALVSERGKLVFSRLE